MENIQKKLDAFLSEAALSGKCPRILLHACCAPCSSYVLEYLSTAAALTVLFYNPNMDTEEEYEKRAAELSRLVKEMGLSE